ncbi:unnamed protein product [Bemisia tabaci]|uniref:Cyclic nucleotide-binding domain-containing protein n=1 Tax=Bemisia tabaci TaxID=7038 RepID=A0A9P0F6G4_BEMTA|nr:unnamed protein product [Bemisia tabaci]
MRIFRKVKGIAKLDGVKTYMRMRRVPNHLQVKVIKWFDYLWLTQKCSDEEKAVSCLPGEVGKEMYIVNRGRLQVVADNGKTVLATLKAGSYFGEISILNMGTAGKNLGKYSIDRRQFVATISENQPFRNYVFHYPSCFHPLSSLSCLPCRPREQ